MPAQIGDWLPRPAGPPPEAAAEGGAPLLALMRADAIPGPPLVTDPDPPEHGRAAAADPREALDQSYQQLLEVLQNVRREVSDAATSRKRTELRLEAAGLDPTLRP